MINALEETLIYERGEQIREGSTREGLLKLGLEVHVGVNQAEGKEDIPGKRADPQVGQLQELQGKYSTGANVAHGIMMRDGLRRKVTF